jgi:hypothetical protein
MGGLNFPGLALSTDCYTENKRYRFLFVSLMRRFRELTRRDRS